MKFDSDIENTDKFTPKIVDDFKQSEIYPYFGLAHIQSENYNCVISLVVSASEDIEIEKVIDFLKDFIPAQFEENNNSRYLERFKIVNEKMAQVLSDTLEGESFIDVALSYVLIEKSYFYVSMDEYYDLSILRGNKIHNLRKREDGVVTGSGILKPDDKIILSFNGLQVLEWSVNNESKQEEIYENIPVVEETQREIVDEDLDEDYVQNTYESSEDIQQITSDDIESSSYEENASEERPIPSQRIKKNPQSENGSSFLDNLKEKAQVMYQTYSPKVKSILRNSIMYVGEAFSYLISIIFRKKKSGISKALPNKKKGFLIISGIVFCIVLLAFFIKSSGEDNQRKLQEQNYRDQVAQVDKDIKQVETTSNSISLNDKAFITKLDSLRNEVKGVSDNSLKNKLGLDNQIQGYTGRIDSLQDKVDGVVRVDESAVLSRFGGFIPNPNPSGMAIRDGKIYITDLNNAKIYQADANTSGPVTELISQDLSKPQDVEFTKTKLLVLDSNNGISEVDTANKTLKKLAGYDIASSTSTVIKSYYDTDADNFYLLQPSKKDILRVPGLGNGTFAVAGKYNKDDFADDVVNFTIIGGSAYTIDTVGNINKYTRSSSTGALKDPFNMPSLETPIGDGASIEGMTPREQGPVYLFVSDPSNDRIVIFDNKDPNGNAKFVAQFKPKDDKIFSFKDMKALIVDESAGKTSLYALSTYGIFKINVDL